MYDKVNGMTCHQCRQKTLGKHTWCSKCETLHVRARAVFLVHMRARAPCLLARRGVFMWP